MPALSDQSFNPKAYARMTLVAVVLLLLLGVLVMVYRAYQDHVEDPRMLRGRFDDPPGQTGLSSVRVRAMGERAVPTLLDDLKSNSAERRSKAMELLGSIDDPRVVPALGELVASSDVSSQLSGIAALARTGKPEAAARIWPLTQSKDDIVRVRAIVGLGLCAPFADLAKLAEQTKAAGDTDKYVWAWALGRVQRQQERVQAGKIGRLPAAPAPVDEADSARIQAEVDATLRLIDREPDPTAAAKKLAELTDVDYGAGDFAHAVSLQVLALGGPRQIRSAQLPEGQQRPVAPALQIKDGGRVRLQGP